MFPGSVYAELLDTLVFGNDGSEAAHETSATLPDFKTGGLGEPSRRLLPGGAQSRQGGVMKFVVRVAKVGPRTTVVVLME